MIPKFMVKVLVLMSTWNGGLFLREQINSILRQEFDGEIELWIRDDGSTDNTLSIADEYSSRQIRIIRGGLNLGAKSSFLYLINLARESNADYFALADQDDVWMPGRISRALECIRDSDCPTLYCSALELVDSRLRHLSNFIHTGRRSLRSAIFVNYLTGCTCLFNRSFLGVIKSPENLDQVIMHDWWLCLIGSAFGTIFYDKNPSIKYRQHGSNQIGIERGFRGNVRRLYRCFKKSPFPSRIGQVSCFYATYKKDLIDADRFYLEKMVKGSDRFLRRLKLIALFKNDVDLISGLRFILFK